LRFYRIIGLILIALGIYGTIYSFSFFFGFITAGIFLIILEFMPEKEEPVSASIQHSLRPASDSFNSSIISFCPKCGTKVSESITYCPQCGEKLGAK